MDLEERNAVSPDAATSPKPEQREAKRPERRLRDLTKQIEQLGLPTRPTKASKERRLKAKTTRSTIKSGRGKPRQDD